MAKKTSCSREVPARWKRETPYTTMISARISNELAEQLREHCSASGVSITDTVEKALTKYLRGRGYPCPH